MDKISPSPSGDASKRRKLQSFLWTKNRELNLQLLLKFTRYVCGRNNKDVLGGGGVGRGSPCNFCLLDQRVYNMSHLLQLKPSKEPFPSIDTYVEVQMEGLDENHQPLEQSGPNGLDLAPGYQLYKYFYFLSLPTLAEWNASPF